MRITKLSVKNCLSVGDEGIILDGIGDLTVLVGPNDSGKSNILRSLDLVANVFSESQAALGPFHHLGDEGRELRIELTVGLSENEIEIVTDFLVQSTISSLNSPPVPEIAWSEARRGVIEVVLRCRPLFRQLLDGEITFTLVSYGGPFATPVKLVRLTTPHGDFFAHEWSRLSTSPVTLTGYTPASFPAGIIREIRNRHPGIFDIGGRARILTPNEAQLLADSLDLKWFRSLFLVANNLPSAMDFTQVELQQRGSRGEDGLKEILSLASFLYTNGYGQIRVSLEGLLGFILRSSIVRLSDARVRPDSRFSSDFSSIPTIFRTVDGSEIAGALYKLKNASDPGTRERFRKIQERFKNVAGSEVDVVHETLQIAKPTTSTLQTNIGNPSSPSPEATPEELLPSLRIRRDSLEVPLDLGSAGLYEELLVLFTASAMESGLVLLDEPALNLHPTSQRDLLSAVLGIGTELHNQTFIVTHSSYLVPPGRLDAVVRVSRNAGRTSIHRLASASGIDYEKLKQDLSHFPRLLSALFARRVILVEGAAEEAALPAWLEKCHRGLSFEALNIDFISVDGHGFFARHAAPLKIWGIPMRMIGDRKAAKNLAQFGSDAYAYDADDMEHVITSNFDPVLKQLEKEFGQPMHPDKPTVIRMVAQRTDPPDVVRDIWRFLEPFVIESGDS